MGIAIAGIALVGLLQSVAWIGARKTSTGRAALATMLAPSCALVLALALVHALVPGFFG
jgi:hypothetical protein